MFPERGNSSDCGRVIATLKEIAQAFSLGAAVHGIFWIVDIDLQFGSEEIREAGVRKIQHEAGASDEIDQVIYEAQINGPYRANKLSSPRSRMGLTIDCVLKLFEFRKDRVESRWALVEHHRGHCSVVGQQILCAGFVWCQA